MKKTNRYTSRVRAPSARGFSLVELMVAMLIGLIISIGVVQIFGATRSTYQLDESLARAQENGRFALEFLTQDIRHAGYIGCLRPRAISSTSINSPVTFLAAALPAQQYAVPGITGFEYGGTGIGGSYSPPLNLPGDTTVGWNPALTTPFAPAGIPPLVAGALPGTDVIAIQRISSETWPLVPPYTTRASVFIDPAFASRITPPDTLIVVDCDRAAVFMATSIVPATGQIDHTASATTNRCALWGINCTDPFFKGIPLTNAVIGRMQTIVFFVANDNNGERRPTLFRRVINPNGDPSPSQPLVEGVENFQVLYGVDAVPPFDGAPDRYVTANNVAVAQVVSVKIGILVYGVNATGSANDTEIDTSTHVVAGTNIISPGDRRSRRVFNTTIQLRNRGS